MNPLPSFETIALETPSPHVLVARLNRPEVANALNTQMGRDLLALWTTLTAEPGDIRCVVFTATGGRVFCAGGDLKERNGMTDAQWVAQHEIFERAFQALLDCPVPVIAAVNGHAYAGGLEMVLSSDFAYGVDTARFALTEVTIGIMPGAGGTQTLPRIVGERRAKEIILTGTPFNAQQALDWGILNAVYSAEELLPAALATAERIAGNAPISVRQAKRSIHYGLQMDLRSGMRFEIEAYNRMVPTEDRIEGIRSFNEKRKPVFKGR
ncbi:enoyl-CoA hydratase/isomerase family protein [Roseococcus pinisoli]|uniref:Enoyl-CoA hydratase/isomerase family protein n=1 Tax=Roseococcus pinisoli TaxID=2835040 RepID=A0ABS5QD72_9PROT|nr:enoyl-CoA hydratase-related protein [Roseococcus pinisoli]MBS7811651.1 enoyl-CoA hydratase/isomerase family protein [Roseococcus pinisoli]